MINVFVSYGHHMTDKVALRLVENLRALGEFDVFLDVDCLERDDWEQQITAGIERCDYFLFCVSAKSVNPEGYCLNELSRACELKKPAFPLLFDDSFVPLCITRLQRLFFNRCLNVDGTIIEQTYKPSYEKLLRLLRGKETIGYYNKDISMEDQLQTFDPLEVAHHSLNVLGRKGFFEDFESWLNNESALPIYLLQASPGVGKTAISAAVAARFTAHVAGAHFCIFNNSAKTNPKSIIKSLACQLSFRNTRYAELLGDILKKESTSEADAKRLFEMLILEPCSKCQFDDVQLFVIDALDEAVVHGKNEISEIIVSMQSLLPRWLRFFLTSRPQEDVIGYFHACHKYNLDEKKEENNADIEAFYRKNILGGPLPARSMKLLMEKTHGSFLYASVIVLSIKAGELDPKHVEKFPDGIYSFYTMWFHRIFDDGVPPYEDVRKILSLVTVCLIPPTIDFLCDATGLTEQQVLRDLEAVGSFFYIEGDQVHARHKCIIDWVSNRAHCPSTFLVSKQEGYELLYSYVKKTRANGRGWKRDPYVICDYTRALRHLKNYEELCKVMQDGEYVNACFKSRFYTLYEGFQEYFRNILFLYDQDESYCFDVYDSETFVRIMSIYRMQIYNSGYFLELRSCAFEDYLSQKNSVGSLIGDNIDYEIGVIHFFYISLLFQKAAKRIEALIQKHPLETLDIDRRSEIERMMLLTYRKAVLFDRIEEISVGAIADARTCGNAFEESLDYLTLSKVYCRELKKKECYEAADQAVAILSGKVAEQTDEHNSQMEYHLFLAEDYRVYADAAVWLGNLELAEEMLGKAGSIYALYHVVDRYYPRFLYTSLFFEIVRHGDDERIEELLASVDEALAKSKDKYDKAQFYFLTGLHRYLKSKKDPALLAAVEEPLNQAIALNRGLNVPLELLEAECLMNLLREARGQAVKPLERYNEFTDKWIEYVDGNIRRWREEE